MRYLVAREDTINKSYKSSGEYLPKIVDAPYALAALLAVFDSFGEDYRPMNRNYIVVPMEDAEVITLRPLNQFTSDSRPYLAR